MKTKFVVALTSLMVALAFTACLKTEFDAPPNGTTADPEIDKSKMVTIASLKAMANPNSNLGLTLTDDKIIYGIVIANDASGNFYEQIIIQDSTGGIPVLINKNGLDAEFPLGRKVFVNLKNLVISAYGRSLQLGYAMDASNRLAGIPGNKLNSIVLKGMLTSGVKPRVVSINQITNPDNVVSNAWLNTLIEISDAQFVSGDAGLPYAESGSSGTDRRVEDCTGANVIVRNSGYADFTNAKLPSGKGKLIAVYGRYNGNAQLGIRDTTDVLFSGSRCDSTTNLPIITIQSLRNAFDNGDTLNDADSKIVGVVISDRSSGNFQGRNCIIQDATGGIVVRFDANHSFNVGDEIEVNTTNILINEFNGVLQANAFVSKATRKSTGASITPQVLTMQQIADNLNDYESELVQVNNVSFPAGTYSGSKTISDGSGTSLTLFTLGGSSFANVALPTGSKTVIGIVGEYGAVKQLQIRTPADVK
jgi:hypothetical protein